MAGVEIFWDPKGLNIDTQLKGIRFSSLADGDTPRVITNIRMLSIDTPETSYQGKPSNKDDKLSQLGVWMQNGDAPIKPELANILYPKLTTGSAGSLQEKQGNAAKSEFARFVNVKLTKPNGKKRNLFLRAAEEHFDHYGRLLAYVAPSYSAEEREAMAYKDRVTFNLLMVESGWAASFPIYPSLPKHIDLKMLQEAAEDAYDNARGAYADPNLLTGYEYRMCVKLYGITKKIVDGKKLSTKEKYGWISRYCADMTTKEMFYPQDYYKVKTYNRIFVWPDDVSDAVAKMNLVPSK